MEIAVPEPEAKPSGQEQTYGDDNSLSIDGTLTVPSEIPSMDGCCHRYEVSLIKIKSAILVFHNHYCQLG
jgi:hypothetical protein